VEAVFRRVEMKGSALIAGILIMVGLLAGAAVIAFAGRGDTKDLESKLEAATASMEAATGRIAEMEKKIASLAEKQESNSLLIETNSGRLGEIAQRISRVEIMGRNAPRAEVPGGSPEIPSVDSSPPLADAPEAVEALKEQVKKELQEERLLKEQEEREHMAQQVKQMQTREWRKQIDEDFPRLAQKIGLNPTQEMAIKDIAENAFKQIIALLEDAMNQPQSEVDWVAFQEKMKKIYEEAEAQVVPLVDEEQGKALRKFFEVPGQ
jgi:hypothetical protein